MNMFTKRAPQSGRISNFCRSVPSGSVAWADIVAPEEEEDDDKGDDDQD